MFEDLYHVIGLLSLFPKMIVSYEAVGKRNSKLIWWLLKGSDWVRNRDGGRNVSAHSLVLGQIRILRWLNVLIFLFLHLIVNYLLCQIPPKLIDIIWNVLLASAQDQNDCIVGKYEIIPTRIGKLCLECIFLFK